MSPMHVTLKAGVDVVKRLVSKQLCVIKSNGHRLRWRTSSQAATVGFYLGDLSLFQFSFICVQIEREVLSQKFSITNRFPLSLETEPKKCY